MGKREEIGKIFTSAKTYTLSVAVGIVMYLISWIVTKWSLVSTLNIGGSIVPASALNLPFGTTVTQVGTASPLGVSVMKLLVQIPQYDNVMSFIIGMLPTIVMSFVIIVLGRAIWTLITLPKKQPWKLAMELGYGFIALGLITGVLLQVGVTAIVTLVIYGAIVAFVINLMTRMAWFGRLVKVD